VDDEGEPACGFHRTKEFGVGLNAARATRALVPAPIVPVVPVVQIRKEVAVSDRICQGFNKTCTKPLRERNTSGFCTRCNANKYYHEKVKGKNRSPVTAGASAQRKKRRQVQQAVAASMPTRLLELTDAQIDRALTRIMLLLLPEEKLELLLTILAPAAGPD